jgi:hypothetical protein
MEKLSGEAQRASPGARKRRARKCGKKVNRRKQADFNLHHRETLQQEPAAMTYQVTQFTGQLDARQEALRAQEDGRREAIRRPEGSFVREQVLLTRPGSADAALARLTAGLERLRKALGAAAKPKARTPARPTIRRRPAPTRKKTTGKRRRTR